MRFSRSGFPVSGLKVDRATSLMRRRHAIYDYHPKTSQSNQSTGTSELTGSSHPMREPTVPDLSRVRSRLLRFILENQRRREALEQRGFSSRMRDVSDHLLDE